VEADIFSFLRFPIQEVENLLKVFAISLTYVFNRIIDSGIYPNILQNSNVSPNFK
jgi:hypothetical protein